MTGLVLSGGGARGAYQVGVLRAIAQVCEQQGIKNNPFPILTGVSAGAINAASLASWSHDFSGGVKKLSELWAGLTADQVFRTDVMALGKLGLKWVGDFSFGSLSGSATHGPAVLDTAPLKQLLTDNFDFSAIAQGLKQGHLHAVALSALDYRTSNTVTFIEGSPNIALWDKNLRHAERAKLRVEHILASSAIPMLFPPVAVDYRYFGDGCVRNHSPCSPAIEMGAQKLLVVGVRKQTRNADELHAVQSATPPSIARICNVLLNSVLLDNVEVDLDRLNKVNHLLARSTPEVRKGSPYRSIPSVFVSPSEDIGLIASKLSRHLPRLIRYSLRGLGPLQDASELISYLLFDPTFNQILIDLGEKDGLAQADAIKNLLL